MESVTLTIDRSRRRTARRGFTLAESLIACSVLAVAAVAIVAPILASRQQAAAADANGVAVALARQLLEEIAAKSFADPTDGNTVLGPGGTETSRSLFDNPDDYHGYSDSTPGLAMVGGTSVSLPGSMQYTRTVTVEYRSGPSGPVVTSGDFALVTVTVTPSKGAAVQLSQLLTRAPLKR